MDEGRKRILLIAAAILAARKLAQYEGGATERVPATVSAIAMRSAVRCTYSGTHRGSSRFPVDGGMLVGVQPTGRAFEVQHIHMYRVLDGKIAEHFANRDDVGMMRQLGLLPPPTSMG